MFEVTSEEIGELSDVDLRALVGRLCEAELSIRGLPPSAALWSGNQTAPDGGLDVVVALPPGTAIEGFIPRSNTGFQVKKSDMRPAAIGKEIRPNGSVRPSIAGLAEAEGAYILVSGRADAAHSSLSARQKALRDGVSSLPTAAQLHTDFYDQGRLATWVRQHAGVTAWVKKQLGKTANGWRPYGSWSGAPEGTAAPFLEDDHLRLNLGTVSSTSSRSVLQAIDELRDMLSAPGAVVRLVGLSGVGKTRLAQALFEPDVGSRPLHKSLAIYTDLGDSPDPLPQELAMQLQSVGQRAVLVVDNCGQDLHRRLARLCNTSSSKISVLTIEYDVREDQPEGTQVVTLEPASDALIESLVSRRFPHISRPDIQAIAEVSGGNARVAIALSETVGKTETIAGLSDRELFRRLFVQRNDEDSPLLRAARSLALVYSFNADATEGPAAELDHLAALAGQSVSDIFSHLGELKRRDLLQQRNVWRAILPHALANSLAREGLDDIHHSVIQQRLVGSAPGRLAISFSRRLSFLHDHQVAQDIVRGWLSPGGILSNLRSMGDTPTTMFFNVAPVIPELTLQRLESALESLDWLEYMEWLKYFELLRALAYDPTLFERSAALLLRIELEEPEKKPMVSSDGLLPPLFSPRYSGTHAPLSQRLAFIEDLQKSRSPKILEVARDCLSMALHINRSPHIHNYSFGARSRDYGYEPKDYTAQRQWLSDVLAFIERQCRHQHLESDLKKLVAEQLPRLWSKVHLYGPIEKFCASIESTGFWLDGWQTCASLLRGSERGITDESRARLKRLEFSLRPRTLRDAVLAAVRWQHIYDEDIADPDYGPSGLNGSYEHLEENAFYAGMEVARENSVLKELISEFYREGGFRVFSFGRGLASASEDTRKTWLFLTSTLDDLKIENANVQILSGFLNHASSEDEDIASELLDLTLESDGLRKYLPILQASVPLDRRAVRRLTTSIKNDYSPAAFYKTLTDGGRLRDLPPSNVRDLILQVGSKIDGFETAEQMLYSHMAMYRGKDIFYPKEIIQAGQWLLTNARFGQDQGEDTFRARLATLCLNGPDGEASAITATERLIRAFEAGETFAYDNEEFLSAVFAAHPKATLDVFLRSEDNDEMLALSTQLKYCNQNPIDKIPTQTLLSWCDDAPELRYPYAASFISFSLHKKDHPTPEWSEQAVAIINNSPNKIQTLEILVDRFSPTSWSGSRARIIERNLRLLDDLGFTADPAITAWADARRQEVTKILVEDQKHEQREHRRQDERFE